MSSTDSISSARKVVSAGFTGAKVTPQLPITMLVTPCQQEDVPLRSQPIWASRCVCTSTKPGVTRQPSASTVRCADRTRSGPTSTTRPSATATSAPNDGAPVPSTTVPPLISRSSIGPSSPLERVARSDDQDQPSFMSSTRVPSGSEQ